MIEFDNVSKLYAGDACALRNISLTIPDGELIFLAGPSGAGKSTLLKMIAGIEKPTSGRVMVTGAAPQEAESRAHVALEKVGLLEKANALPLTLSGGEQQRVAIARAIVNRPKIILADEPTAFLDRDNANKVLSALKAFQSAGVTCLISSHDEQFLDQASRVIYLSNGQIVDAWNASHIAA